MKPKRNSSVNTSVWGIKNRPPTRQMQAQIRRLRRADLTQKDCYPGEEKMVE